MNTIVRALAVLAITGLAGVTNASLIGDEIRIDHYFPDLSTFNSGFSRTVTAGTADEVLLVSAYSVNPEADRILINQPIDPGWSVATFNGLVVDGLNDSSGGLLEGITVETDIANWSDSRLSFDTDTIWLNFYRGEGLGPGFVNLILDFGRVESVPAPATLGLFGLGLAGLGYSRRKRA